MAKSATAPTVPPRPATPPVKKKKRGLIKRPKLLIFLLFLVLLILSPFVMVELINSSQQSRIYSEVANVPTKPIAMVFGAGIMPDGSPSWMLADRVNAGVQLFKQGKVERLLMTGDGTSSVETKAMANYAIKQGVPSFAIIMDGEGLRTYDSCWRAINVYGIKQAVLVTQGYHLPRALYLCNSLGIEAVGLKAGRDEYPNQGWFNFREFWATVGSWADVNFLHPTPEGNK